jgi:folate-binding protein YgfZ
LHLPVSEPRSSTRRVRRDGVVVDGPDAAAWLQGQVSQDVETLGVGDWRWSLVLSPQGKVDSFCRITRVDEHRLLLDVEAGHGEMLLERLRRFKIRVKVTLELVPVLCEESLGGGFDALSPARLAGDEDAGAAAAPDDERFEAARILAGVPRLGRELTDRTIPQEAGEGLVERTVSFTKGCYTGQELVARLDARGSNVPRRLRLVRGARDRASMAVMPLRGDELRVGGAEVGRLTSVARSKDGFVALAYVKRSALTRGELPATVLAGGSEEVPVTVTGFESES